MMRRKTYVNLCSKDFLELLEEISNQKEKPQQDALRTFRLSSAFYLPFPEKLLTDLYGYGKISMEREIAPTA